MEIIKTEFEGLFIIKPAVFEDARGYFMVSHLQNVFAEKIGNISFIQENESLSSFGVLRGLHYQLPPFAQSKLVSVVKGKVQDVAVDLRKGSATFGKYFSMELSEENKLQLFIPQGFAHGFLVLSEQAVFQYKCDNYYAPNHEASISYNDPDLNIKWQLEEKNINVSAKDKSASDFKLARYFDAEQ